jgi:hypothetical protein
VHFARDVVQPLLHAISLERAVLRREIALRLLIGEVLHDGHAFGEHLAVVELERRHGTLGIDGEVVRAILELLGLGIGALELDGQTGLEGGDVRGERTGARGEIQLHEVLHYVGLESGGDSRVTPTTAQVLTSR